MEDEVGVDAAHEGGGLAAAAARLGGNRIIEEIEIRECIFVSYMIYAVLAKLLGK